MLVGRDLVALVGYWFGPVGGGSGVPFAVTHGVLQAGLMTPTLGSLNLGLGGVMG